MIRQTSIEAYRKLVEEGSLPEARKIVYGWLYRNGPATAGEIEESMNSRHAHKRLSELRDSGFILECGVKICSHSGKEGIVWDVTDRCEPVEPVEPVEPRLANPVREYRISVVCSTDCSVSMSVLKSEIEKLFEEGATIKISSKEREARTKEPRSTFVLPHSLF